MRLFERSGGKLLAYEDIIDFDGCISSHLVTIVALMEARRLKAVADVNHC